MATTSFFVSYTGADTAWAEWIAWQLEAVGYQATLQAWDSRPGNDFVVWMDRAIRDAERIVVVLTPAYQEATSFTVPEWSAAIGRDPTGELGVLVPIRVADFTPEGLLRTRGWIDLVGKDRVAAKATLLAGVVQGRMKPKEEPVFPGERPPEPAFPGPTEPGRAILNLPPRNLNFTGRDDLLRQLAEQLTVGTATAVVQAQAVHGLGGVGKTQLAIEYAHRHQADYDLIWWITADQPLAIPGQLVALARRLGLADAPEQAETIRSLWDELRRRDRWLLIFDNAEQLADLRPLWPPGGSGHVLVTSRNPVWRGLAEPLAVDVLAREQAVTFLARRTGSQDSGSLDALAEVLGDLPLALEQASAYIEETVIPIGEYVSLFTERAAELFNLGRASTTEQTIATIWTLSLKQIHNDTPAAQDLLTLCGFLAPDDIPRPLLADHAGKLPERLAEAVADPLSYNQAIGGLRRYSLITATQDALSVHRLVQAVVRNRPDQAAAGQWALAALHLVESAFPSESYEFDNWPECAQLFPHALAVIGYSNDLIGESLAMAALLGKAGLTYGAERSTRKHNSGSSARWRSARVSLAQTTSIPPMHSGVLPWSHLTKVT